MLKRSTILVLILQAVIIGVVSTELKAWEPTGKYRDLNSLSVSNNIYKIRSQRKCIGCFLVDAYLVRANLRGVNLQASNLTRAKLMSASLYGANLSGVILDGADLSGAQWTNGKICKEGSIGTCITDDDSSK